MTKWILVIDDDDEIREVVQATLEELGGWFTITATSGIEGLQAARTEALDAILLDISMPDMDGFQICEALQADPKTCKIPIIMLTAKALRSDQQRFAELDIAGVILKPFNPMTICSRIAELLDWTL